jgi:4'-phosphopantetheinyl transferase
MTDPMEFQPAQPAARPGANAVHIWRVRLDAPDATVVALAAHLSADEQAQMAWYRHARGARRYAVSHGALRVILGHYLGVAPLAVDLSTTSEGKPFVAAPAGDGLEFNLTHSGDMALVAVTTGRPVGVDVEWLRPIDVAALAVRYFSAPERTDLAQVAGSPDERLAFFQCWTRKEALLKATGTGLHRPLASFAVTLLPGAPPGLAWSEDPGEPAHWSLASLAPAPGYVAAVAVPGPVGVLSGWQFGADGGTGLYSDTAAG